MKVNIRVQFTIRGQRSKSDKTLVERTLELKSKVSFPVLPRIGDAIDFDNPLMTATVKRVMWHRADNHKDVFEPTIHLHDVNWNSPIDRESVDGVILSKEVKEVTERFEESGFFLVT